MARVKYETDTLQWICGHTLKIICTYWKKCQSSTTFTFRNDRQAKIVPGNISRHLNTILLLKWSLVQMAPCPHSAWGQLALKETIHRSNLEVSKDHSQKVVATWSVWVHYDSWPQRQRMVCGTFDVLMQLWWLSIGKTSYPWHLFIYHTCLHQ